MRISKKRKEDDIHIKILKYCRNNPNFTIKELQQKFPGHEGFLHSNFYLLESGIFVKNRFESFGKPEDAKYILGFEGRSLLLQHEELEHAKESSNFAIWIAIGALMLTFFGLVASMHFVSEVRIMDAELPILDEMKELSTQNLQAIRELNTKLDAYTDCTDCLARLEEAAENLEIKVDSTDS
ncbi:MAG: hypothetical protein KAT43_02260 [Nanoarchaeota archaeon]|nr:hypothetical protein [Nanoarchaeota archaeon]